MEVSSNDIPALLARYSCTDPRDAAFADHLDRRFSPIAPTRLRFSIPSRKAIGSKLSQHASDPAIYFIGNSLGLQAHSSRKFVEEELDMWANGGIVGHFDHSQNRPWIRVDEEASRSMAKIVGANPSETAVCGTLTSNLHKLLTAFYRPDKKRFKILFEKNAFPSDRYAFASQVQIHGFDPKEALIQLEPKENEHTLRTQDIVDAIKKHGESIAIVLFSGVQFYTGQYFDIPTITAAGHAKGCIVGWDLAHAVGNVPVKLHDWDVDFAVWCHYKYVNSGPGSIGGFFVHDKHDGANKASRFAGWWGNNPQTRFDMLEEFDAADGAAGYKLSNPDILSIASLLGSLKVFDEAYHLGNTDKQQHDHYIGALREKSMLMTAYLENLLMKSDMFIVPEKIKEAQTQQKPGFSIITPTDPSQRGAQLSLLFFPSGCIFSIFKRLVDNGLIGDERNPDIIRLAPAPLYNTFDEVRRAAAILDNSLHEEFHIS